MHLYKYRDLSALTPELIEQLSTTLSNSVFWAARPDALNDPEEFIWSCSYSATRNTAVLLGEALQTFRNADPTSARLVAQAAVASKRIQAQAEPIIRLTTEMLRSQAGLICFGQSSKNKVLWRRYGGGGDGIAIEVRVDDDLLGRSLHKVRYVTRKRVHIDEMLRASLPGGSAQSMYVAALLTKPSAWASEREVRFVSSQHSRLIRLGKITAVVMGRRLSRDARVMLREMAEVSGLKLREVGKQLHR